MITRAFFYDYVLAHGCTTELLKGANITGTAVKIINPKTNGYIYLDLPIDDKHMTDFTVYRSCIKLGVDMLKECEYIKPIDEHIDEQIKNHNHHNKKKGKQ